MLELPKALNADWQPRTWHSYNSLNGEPVVYINDGKDLLSLAFHNINRDGTVQPIIRCPLCGFHDSVKLLGWEK